MPCIYIMRYFCNTSTVLRAPHIAHGTNQGHINYTCMYVHCTYTVCPDLLHGQWSPIDQANLESTYSYNVDMCAVWVWPNFSSDRRGRGRRHLKWLYRKPLVVVMNSRIVALCSKDAFCYQQLRPLSDVITADCIKHPALQDPVHSLSKQMCAYISGTLRRVGRPYLPIGTTRVRSYPSYNIAPAEVQVWRCT